MHFLRSIRDHLYPSRFNAHRPHLLRRGPLMALLALVLVSEALVVGGVVFKQGPQVFLAAVVQSDIISFTTKARAAEGGTPLVENELLSAAAQAKAEDMAQKSYFSHTSPNGDEPWVWIERAGYEYSYAGENLAVRFDDSEDVVKAWMASPTHRANIVKAQYQEIGVGLAEGIYKGGRATFVVQYFARPAVSAAAPSSSDVALGTEVPIQTTVVSAPEVAGAETPVPTAEPKATWAQSSVRFISGFFADIRAHASLVLASVAILLMAVLALTFVVRIQVQPTDLLVPGLAVAAIALVCMGANAKFLPSINQSASVAASTGDVGEGAAVERIVVGQ